MDATPPTMPRRKQLALIAHDNRKADLLEWAQYNRGTLAQHELHATGTTGAKLAAELGLPVHRFLAGLWAAISRLAPRSRREGSTS